jgi:cell division protein FtsI (penicillin-binding protein 3)
VASFAGYVPLENPRLTIVVIIDEPQGEAWGGTVAAPVFRRVAEQVLPYLGVASQEPIKLALATHTGIQKAR